MLSGIEVLIQKIIKRQKNTNKKINFMAYHFSQDIMCLPIGSFTNDNEDTQL